MSDVETLIVGAGFAGLSVAHKLSPDRTMIIDSGMPYDPGQALRDYKFEAFREQPGLLSNIVDAEALAIRRDPAGEHSLPFSGMSVNVYAGTMGGISNWWGGYCARLTAETFNMNGLISWPIGLEDLSPYYEHAEQLLHVHGDPTCDHYSVVAPLPGWESKESIKRWFPAAHVNAQAKNVSGRALANLGVCTGNGHCALCANDAKARPATVFPMSNVIGGAKVDYVRFNGDRAVSAVGRADGESFEISFDRIVLAAGGVENVAVLQRSDLPQNAPLKRIGRCYQDHTAAEIAVRFPITLPRLAVGAEAHYELPELSGYFQGIEVKTLLLTTPPSPFVLGVALGAEAAEMSDENISLEIDKIGVLYLQMEIPPEWDLRLETRAGVASIDSFHYLENVFRLDAVTMAIAARVSELGLEVLGVVPHHRAAFGGHHYSGTTPMSRNENAVVMPDHRLIGTSNVYINGGSVLPRCGGSGPTLSIVAMGLRLGDILHSIGS